ncbi:hypothetical protein HAX54_008845, partial [Datura stramonium]|nr:hypothetical protein [Datura stramonium]
FLEEYTPIMCKVGYWKKPIKWTYKCNSDGAIKGNSGNALDLAPVNSRFTFLQAQSGMRDKLGVRSWLHNLRGFLKEYSGDSYLFNRSLSENDDQVTEEVFTDTNFMASMRF